MTGLGWRTQFITYPSLVFLLSFCFIFYKAPDLPWIRSCVSFFHSYLGHGSRQEIFYDQYFTSFVSAVALVLPEEKETWEQFLFLAIRLLQKSALTFLSSLLPLPSHSNLTSSWVLQVISDLIIYFCCPSTSILQASTPEILEPELPYFTAALSNNYQQWKQEI